MQKDIEKLKARLDLKLRNDSNTQKEVAEVADFLLLCSGPSHNKEKEFVQIFASIPPQDKYQKILYLADIIENVLHERNDEDTSLKLSVSLSLLSATLVEYAGEFDIVKLPEDSMIDKACDALIDNGYKKNDKWFCTVSCYIRQLFIRLRQAITEDSIDIIGTIGMEIGLIAAQCEQQNRENNKK